jgi:site-specific DNA recombinase
MKKCYIYCRFSSSNQREESIDAQIRICKDYCKKNSIEILHIYSDKALSGKTDQREEFQNMLKDSTLKEVDYIVVAKLDRFSRNRYHSAIEKGNLQKLGIKVLSATENLDDSPESILLESMLEGLSAYYSENLKRETFKGLFENAYKAISCGGVGPIGYEICPETKRHKIVAEEAKIVSSIFNLYLNENWGFSKIARHLNEKGLRTRQKRLFLPNLISSILRNKKYMGTFVYNLRMGPGITGKRRDHLRKPADQVIEVPNAIPPIVTKKQWLAAAEKLGKNKKRGGQFKAKRIYLVSGKVFCGECGNPFHGNSRRNGKKRKDQKQGKLYVNYSCSLRAKMKSGCNNLGISAEILEGFVLNEIQRLILSPSQTKSILKKLEKYVDRNSNEVEERSKELKNALAQVKTKITRLINAIKEGINLTSVKVELENLEDRKNELQLKLQSMAYKQEIVSLDEIKEALKKFREAIKQKDHRNIKKLIDVFVERIDVFLDRIEVQLKIDMTKQSRKENGILLEKPTKKRIIKNKQKAA